MEPWIIWLIIGVALLIVEMLNAGFGIICFGIGAFLSAIVAACGLGLAWQLAALALGAFLSYLFVRPIMVKWFDAKDVNAKTNLDNMVGRKATVVEDVTETGGRVAIDGTDWIAISASGETKAKGTIVTIRNRESNKLFVE